MTSAEFKELSDIILEQKKVMGEMRNDWEHSIVHKKDIEDLAAQYKTLKDAISDIQSKTAMQANGATAEPEYKKIWSDFARKGVNNTIVGPQGGFLVPKPLHTQIMELAAEDNFIRQNATILSTNEGSLDIPYEKDGDTVDFIGELATKPSAEVKFDLCHINIFDLNREVPVTKQLIEDSAFDIESYVIQHIAKKVANAEENSFLNGQSPVNPEGILKATGLGNVTAASATAITWEELVDMRTQSGVAKSSILDKAKYLVNPATFQAMMKFKDTNNRPLMLPIGDKFQPAFQGFPIGISTAMPGMTTGKKSVVFGDFSGYVIVDRAQGIEIQRNPYRVGGQVIFEFWHRVGAAVGDKSKLVTLTQA